MTSSYYTSIKNTVVSGSALQSNLTVAQLEQLILDVTLSSNPIVTMLNSDLNYLTYDNWVTAITSTTGLGINGSVLTAARNLNIFSDAVDTAAYAAGLMGLFNLSSAGSPVVAKFRVANADLPAWDVELNNKAATSANVQIIIDGGAAAVERILLPASATVGYSRTVEIYGTNFTSGSQVVVFNIGTAV